MYTRIYIYHNTKCRWKKQFLETPFSPKGGVKAVVYTDVVQTLLMFGGVVTVVAVSCKDLGGLGGVLQIADRGGRLEFFK